MLTAQVAIIGGGLSGLYAASLLEERGGDYILLEARPTFGGRIVSVPGSPDTAPDSALARYDLGATWFWPDMQSDLMALVTALGLPTFRQYEEGDLLVERSPSYPPSRIDGYASAPPALRMAGGMGALTAALHSKLAPERLHSGRRVTRLTRLDDAIELTAVDALGTSSTLRVNQVLLAAPPRLAVTTLDFMPALPEQTARQWKSCATWMAPHAKYVAVYDQPFWRKQGLSGGARSSVGPLVEIHDASPENGGAALFGFLGVPADVRRTVPESTLAELCRAQLVRLFGRDAGSPSAEYLKDWATDPCTAVAEDQYSDGHHAMSLPSTLDAGAWKGRLIGIASEWSPLFSGYAAGAIDAARRGVAALTAST